VEGDDPDEESADDDEKESVDESERCTECGEHTDEACEICGPKCESCHPDMRTDLLDGNTYCDECEPDQTNAASKHFENALDCDAKGVSTSLYVYRKLY